MVLDLLFRVGPGIQAVFELGFEPKEELFYELTFEQYSQLEREGRDISKRWYTILPEEQKYNVPELLIVDEEEKDTLLDAAEYINNMCSNEGGKNFSSFEEKLEYAAGILPGVFSGSSRYAEKKKVAHLKKNQIGICCSSEKALEKQIDKSVTAYRYDRRFHHRKQSYS